MTFEDEAEQARRRSAVYWLLSGLFLEKPEQPSLEALRDALDAHEQARRHGDLLELREALEGALATPDALEALQVEFTRLIRAVGRSKGVPEPYESVAREGRLLGDSTAAVSAFIRDAGLADIAPEAGPPDHIGTELRFLSLLCFDEASAWQTRDADVATTRRQQQIRFLDEHALRWIPAHCTALESAARHPFYTAAARLTAQACMADREELDAAGKTHA